LEVVVILWYLGLSSNGTYSMLSDGVLWLLMVFNAVYLLVSNAISWHLSADGMSKVGGRECEPAPPRNRETVSFRSCVRARSAWCLSCHFGTKNLLRVPGRPYLLSSGNITSFIYLPEPEKQ